MLTPSEKQASQKPKPPIIVKPLTATVCKVGDAVKMETVITGVPSPQLTWLFNDRPMGEAAGNARVMKKENIYTLLIDNITQGNDGEYRVKAENEAGMAQTSANICVQGKANVLLTFYNISLHTFMYVVLVNVIVIVQLIHTYFHYQALALSRLETLLGQLVFEIFQP